MAEELNDQERRELARWRSGELRKSWPVIESTPDGLRYAAELARAQGTEGGDEHDELLRQAAIRLRDLNDVARVLLADRDRLHSWSGLMELLDEHYPASIFVGDGSNEAADPGARIVALTRELGRLRREVEFEANGGNPIRLMFEVVKPSLRDEIQRRISEGAGETTRPVCACSIDFAAMDSDRWSRPQCAVHPDGQGEIRAVPWTEEDATAFETQVRADGGEA